jgi:hypothetical protein
MMINLYTGNLWSCSVELIWLLDTPLAPKLTDLTRWTCGPELYPGKPFLPVLSILRVRLIISIISKREVK